MQNIFRNAKPCLLPAFFRVSLRQSVTVNGHSVTEYETEGS